MTNFDRSAFLSIFPIFAWLLVCSFVWQGQKTAASECVVATVQPYATDAGVAAFERGGNAVDAAIAAAITLGVVDNHNSGLGGGCFILIREADGSIVAIDGREMAPAAARHDMYLRDGVADPQLSTTGPLAVGVPGALAAYQLALKTSGELTLPDLLRPAADIAEKGFAIDRSYAGKLARTADTLAQFPGSKAALLKPDGSVYTEGEILRQPDLARTYRQIADRGPDWFYRGEFAETIADWMAENGGIVTADDFANYHPVQRLPIISSYREWKILGFPPPSSGGVHVAQILNILETFDLSQEFQQDQVRATNIIIEAMKLAFADRAYWLGDPDYVDVPAGLVSEDYAKELAGRIDPAAATPVPGQGDPLKFSAALFERHTTHIAAADSDGTWVAITATVNTTFGSKVIVPGTGLVLNNEMDDFSSQPGVPNAFGLIGAENNAVAAGKRPLSSMSPTIVLDSDDQPVLTVGAAGGPKIITQVLLALVRTLDRGQSLEDAITGARFHHQWKPDHVLIERKASPTIVSGLEKLGHQIKTISSSGVTQAIGLDDSGQMVGVHDPRVQGKVGYGKRKAESGSRSGSRELQEATAAP